MAFVDAQKIRRIIAENENLMANNRALKTSLDEFMSSSKFLVEVLRKNGIMEDISPSRKEYSRLKKQLGEKRQTVMAEHPGQPHNNREMHIYGYFEHELRVLIDENTKYLRRAHDAEIAAKQTITLTQQNEQLETKLKNISSHSGTRNRLTTKNEEQKDRIQTMEKEVNQLSEENRELRKEKHTLADRLEQLLPRIDNITTTYAEMKEKYDALTAKTASSSRKRVSQQTQHEALVTQNDALKAEVRRLEAETKSFSTPLESVLKAPLITEIGNLRAQLQTLQDYIVLCDQSAERNSTTKRRLEEDNKALKQEVNALKAIKSENTQLVGLQTELKAEINRSSNTATLHKQTGLLDRIKKVFVTQPIPEQPKEKNVAQQAAKIRAFGENASNSGTPIWDRVKRFPKPPTKEQKLRAKYRQVRKTKGTRDWESVKLTPES